MLLRYPRRIARHRPLPGEPNRFYPYRTACRYRHNRSAGSASVSGLCLRTRQGARNLLPLEPASSGNGDLYVCTGLRWFLSLCRRSCRSRHPQIWNGFPAFKAQIPYLPWLHVVLQPFVKSAELFHCPADQGIVIEDFTGLELDCLPTCYGKYGTSYLYRTEIAVRQMGEASFRRQQRSMSIWMVQGYGTAAGRVTALLGLQIGIRPIQTCSSDASIRFMPMAM